MSGTLEKWRRARFNYVVFGMAGFAPSAELVEDSMKKAGTFDSSFSSWI